MGKVTLSILSLMLVVNISACASSGGKGDIIHLTNDSFKTEIFNYETEKEWNYNGELPAIVDFYADWCGPCKMLAPILEDLQKDYNGKIQIYKVDTQKERELAGVFGIRSLPTIVFIPANGQPQAVMGYHNKEQMEQIISEILKVSK